MKDLYHPLILVAILITGRADAVLERNRREGDDGGYLVNLNTEAQLSDEIAGGGADEDQILQAPNGLSFSGSNEAGESFGAEANAVAEYDGEGRFNGGKNHFVPPSSGFGYRNQLMAEAQASISTKVQSGKQAQYAEQFQADPTAQSNLQAQFEPEAQYGQEIQENQGVQYIEVPSVLSPSPGIMQYSYETTPGTQISYGLVGPSTYSDNLKKINTFKENPMLVPYSKLLIKLGQESGSLDVGQSNTVPSNPTNAYGGPFVGTIPQPDRGMYSSIPHTGLVSTTNQQSLPMSVTRYDVSKTYPDTVVQENDNQTPNWSPYQKGNPPKGYNNNQNWNPYTKPAEGETLVHVDGEIQSGVKTEADTVVRENGKQSPNWIPYQKGNPNKSVLQTDVVSPNSYNNNWNPYTKPAEGKTLVQPDGENQSGGGTYANTVYQENDKQTPIWSPYQKGNPPIFYNNNNNWNPYIKPAEDETLVQPDGEIQSDGKTYPDTVVHGNDNQTPNWSPFQKGNPPNVYNSTWNPYTQTAEGETLVQSDGEIQSDEKTEAQYNGKPQYQKETLANSVVQMSKGLEVTDANAATKTFAGYGGYFTDETQPTLIGQINSENQNELSTQTDLLVQSNGGFQYSGENKIPSLAKADADIQTNIAPAFSGGSPNNRDNQYLAADQINEGIKYGVAKNSENSLYGNLNKYNGGYLNGEGFQANADSHFENGAQFGAAVAGNKVVQAGPVVKARFGQTNHSSRRPLLAFTHSRNRWHQG